MLRIVRVNRLYKVRNLGILKVISFKNHYDLNGFLVLKIYQAENNETNKRYSILENEILEEVTNE